VPERELPQAGDPPRPRQDRLYVGKLIEHNASNYEFHPKGPRSYYVTLLTDNGRQTLWGAGLAKAFAESKTQPKLGDLIGIRENNLDPVSIVTRKQVNGVVQAERQYDTPRPHWVVEKLEEFDRRRFAAQALRDPTIPRRDAVMSHRELLGFYWVLDAGKKVAEEKIAHPDGQKRFLALMRETLARAVERGEPPPLPAGATEEVKRVTARMERERSGAIARTPE
jgi:sarcosine oxidase delta subunit